MTLIKQRVFMGILTKVWSNMFQKIQIITAVMMLALAASLALVYNASASDNPYYSERIGVAGCSNTDRYVNKYNRNSSVDILWDKVSLGGGHLAAWADIEGEGAIYWSMFQNNLEEMGAKAVMFQMCIRAEWTSAAGMTLEQQNMLTTVVNHIRELTSADTDVYVLPLNHYEDPDICTAVGPYGVPNSVELADWAAATGLGIRGPDTGPLTSSMLTRDNCHPNNAGQTLGAQQLIDYFDNQAPVLTITNPADNSEVSGTVNITADASDANGLVKVDFYLDDALVLSDTTAPYEAIWDTTLDYDGTFSLKAIAVDTTQKTSEQTITVTSNNDNANTAPVALIADDGNGMIVSEENQPVTFDGSQSYDNEGTIVSYEWDFGDGNTGSGAIFDHSYGSAGTYTASLTVTDDGGLVGVDTVEVLLGLDEAPNVTIISPADTAEVSGLVTIEANASDGGTIVQVDFIADGTLISTDLTAPYEAVWDSTTGYDDEYVLRAIATDDSGQTDEASITVTTNNGIVNTHPTAVINDGTTEVSVREGVMLSLDAANSYDNEGTVESYEWNLGDGTLASGPQVEHVYETPGDYTVSLSVLDDGGLEDITTLEVTVEADTAPSVAFTTLGEGSIVSGNVLIEVEATDDISIASVDFFINEVLLSSDVAAPYAATWDSTVDYDGSYAIRVMATDSIGQTTSQTINVNVDNGYFNTNPTAVIANDGNGSITVEFGQSINFDGSASFDNETVIETYEWNFGNGSPLVYGPLVNYTYPIAGTYTATLTVTDDEGLSGSDTVTVTVEEPEGGLTASVNPAATGQIITFTDSDNTSSIRRRWHMGDGQMIVTNSQNSIEYSYSSAGTYTVQLETKDASGNRVTLSLVIVVN